eukprot:TRINITY_DN10006_c0_g4_i1.p1 TRINITY_DN10006_c0_g4~~TRINITY_DN10006_c0_g4_i1.p1  ORF type:complete len:352 (+),score=56.00 TRINITY_DN10006_c0_g4_i1:62-1117(+)
MAVQELSGSNETLPLVSKGGPRPSAVLVHGGVILAYVCFGGGSVVSKFGVQSGNPLIFELCRELIAGPLICLVAVCKGSSIKVEKSDRGDVFKASLLFFCGQLCYFVGLALTDPITAAVWSAVLPVFVSLLAAALGYETAKNHQFLGIATTVLGAAGIPVVDSLNLPMQMSSTSEKLLGHIVFAVCIASQATYIVVSSKLTAKYDAMAFSGIIFVNSSFLFAATMLSVARVPPLLQIICSAADARHGTSACFADPWILNEGMLLPLVYEVLVCSLVAWSLLAWSTRHANALVSSIYVAAQPLTAAAISGAIVKIAGVEWSDRYSIHAPHYYHFIGLCMIVSGLFLTFRPPS